MNTQNNTITLFPLNGFNIYLFLKLVTVVKKRRQIKDIHNNRIIHTIHESS